MAKNKIKVTRKDIKRVPACRFCFVSPVEHTVITQEETISVFDEKTLSLKVETLPKKENKALHCPKCHVHNGFVMIEEKYLRPFNRGKVYTK